MIYIEEIEKQVHDVIAHSQDFEPNVHELVNNWYNAKRKFINLFDNQMIYEFDDEISIDLSKDDKNYKLKDFCDFLREDFSQYPDLIHFIEANEDSFFSNILEKDYTENGYDIKAGIKISKAFRKFVADEGDLYLIQTAASRVIQENKITGHLCLSVHPLDYLSSSENTYNWRSCHALDGSYRAGNLSYMTDKSTIVCYLKGADDVILPRFPSNVKWNNKKWRMLLHVSDNGNALFAGRHYPFFSHYLMDLVQKIYISLNHLNGPYGTTWGIWSRWHNDSIKSFEFSEYHEDDELLDIPYIPIKGSIVKLSDLVEDNPNPLHFNDILKSTCYEPYYCWDKQDRHKIHFSIGRDVKCLSCGGWTLQEPESMICNFCSENNNKFVCVDCGEVIPEYEAMWNYRGDPICTDCADLYYDVCDICGELYPRSEMVYSNDGCVCRNCYEGEE